MVRPPAAWTISAADANSARTNAINAFIRTSVYREDVSYGVTSPDNLHPTFRTIGQTCRRKSKSLVACGRTFGRVWSAEGPARRRHDNPISFVEELHESDLQVLSVADRACGCCASRRPGSDGKHSRASRGSTRCSDARRDRDDH